MNRPAIAAMICAAALGGCVQADAAPAPPVAAYAAANLLAEPDAADRPSIDGVAASRSSSSTPHRRSARDPHPAKPLGGVDAANRAAVSEPSAESYVGALQVYPWREGALYRLYAAPGQVSDIALEPGERLVSVASGDTVRWIIGDTSSGTGPTRQTHILVKPSAPGLATNLVIATDRRVYHIEALSTERTAMASIAWTYPADALVAFRGPAAAEDAPAAAAVAVDSLNFGYRIEGDKPPWRPVRAFDDGRQVFIEFPSSLGEREAPPLFVTGPDAHPELVNYRMRGRYYIVDRLFAAAELRIGEKHQQVVRIVRDRTGQGGREVRR